MSSVLDMLLGGEDPVSVMQPGPVRTERKGGLFPAIVGAAQNYNPVSLVSDAVANYRALAGNTTAPETQPLTTEWVAKKLGVDTEDPAYQAGSWMPGPGSLSKLGMLAGAGFVTRASKVPGAKQTWKGVDNIERANVDDRFAELTKSIDAIPDNSFRRLGDVYKHDKLFEMYPETKDIVVRPMPKGMLAQQGNTTRAAYDRSTGTIYVRKGLTKEEAASSILHEIGHDIQQKEGLLPGTNTVETLKIASALKNELALLEAQEGKARAEAYKRMAKKKLGLDLDASDNNLATQIYLKQQGEGDSIGSQRVYEAQQKMRPYVTPEEFAALPQPEFKYNTGKPINKDTVFRDVFGYDMMQPDEVDLGVNGTPGFRGRIKDSDILGY